jgi:hypothetical protein
MEKLVEEHLKRGGYTIQGLVRESGEAEPFKLVSMIPNINEVESQNTVFYLKERALHVFSEAHRVHEFCRVSGMEGVSE